MNSRDWLLTPFRGFGASHEGRALDLVQDALERDGSEAFDTNSHDARGGQGVVRGGGPSICVGTTLDSRGRPTPLRLPTGEIVGGGHGLVNGASGSGKTFWAISVLLQLLALRLFGIAIIDAKGELSWALRDIWLPALLDALPTAAADALARRIVVLAPFDPRAAPPLQVLRRDPTLAPRHQAREVATSFGHTVGRDLGAIQRGLLNHALVVAIEAGLALPDLPRLLSDADTLRGALERTSDEDAVRYFRTRFTRERSASLGSLLLRLEELTTDPTLRPMLSAPGMIRFDQILEDSLCIIDLGNAPAGMADVKRFFGQFFFRKLHRAIWTRPRVRTNRPAMLIADEFQELVDPDLAREASALLALARSQNVFLWTLFQQLSQVEQAGPELVRALVTNTTYQLQFRASVEDARRLVHVLPATGTRRARPNETVDLRRAPDLLSESEERNALLRSVETMPRQMAWFLNRNRPHGAVLLKSPTLDLARARQRAARLPAALRDFVSRGVVASFPRTTPNAREQPPDAHRAESPSAHDEQTESVPAAAHEPPATPTPGDARSRSARPNLG